MKGGGGLGVEDLRVCITKEGQEGECMRLENNDEGASDGTADHRASQKVSGAASPSALIETCTGPLQGDV